MSCYLTAWGQNGNVNCGQGPQELQNTDDPTKEQVGEAKSTIEYSYDPNEIIGPIGSDFVTVDEGTEDESMLVITGNNWVNTGTMNFTVNFENK